jgi:hypothetical protein
MPDAQTSIFPIKCANCGQSGSVTWNAPTAPAAMEKSLGNLVKVSTGFHWETGRMSPGQVLIVCDGCDEIQA